MPRVCTTKLEEKSSNKPQAVSFPSKTNNLNRLYYAVLSQYTGELESTCKFSIFLQ